MNNLLGKAVLSLGLGALAIACGQSYGNTSRGPQTTAGVQTADPNSASINRVTGALCERDMRCGNVGEGKKYSSESTCLSERRNDYREELNSSECPGGIDQRQLDKCLSEIRAEHCGNALDKISRVTACRDAALCMR